VDCDNCHKHEDCAMDDWELEITAVEAEAIAALQS
jgi:hypothetical protein